MRHCGDGYFCSQPDTDVTGLFASAILILKVGLSRPQKCHVFGSASCSCYGSYFFLLSEGRIEKSHFPVFLTQFLSFCFLSPYSMFSAQSTKKAYPLESSRGSPAERAGRHHLWGGRAHPFTQDPAMPPLTPPNTLAQLEEACRRLAEVSKPPKQR